ncbi:MAG: hypothetical protein IJ308_00290 [Clostridia bacterium]|nr:hypothetical protein [Clostridia bacterium]
MKKAILGKPQILETAEDFNRLPKPDKQASYGELVERLIRKKYSVSAELAILRQRDEKPEEFAVYNAYAEQCKAEAKKYLKE